MNHDDFTFGNDPAAISLARILKESNDKHLSKRISNLIHKFDVLINAIKNIENKETKKSFYLILRNELKERTKNSPYISNKAHSHARTHILTRLKMDLLR